MGSTSRDFTFNFSFASICTREEPRTGKPVDFIPEAQDEVIIDAVLHKLDIHQFNPSKVFWRDSTETKAPT